MTSRSGRVLLKAATEDSATRGVLSLLLSGGGRCDASENKAPPEPWRRFGVRWGTWRAILKQTGIKEPEQ